MWVLFARQVLRSPAPYAEASARFLAACALKSYRRTSANATATAHKG
ncbi:hypothetical protein [Campylobacter magnus]|nr:hypothetical protein [Campylobacter magnus]MDD0856225.1 hypothetical protein [Campylobacter magnus]